MKLEVVVLAAADAERAKDFDGQLGWRLGADFPSITVFGSSSSRRPARAARFSSART
jgi:hypothetical protein